MPYKNPFSSAARRSAIRCSRRYRLRHRGIAYRNVKRSRKPEAHRAQEAVRYAIRTGKIARPKRCSRCGSRHLIQAHHFKGYAKKNYLVITWLCQPCHKLEHRRGK